MQLSKEKNGEKNDEIIIKHLSSSKIQEKHNKNVFKKCLQNLQYQIEKSSFFQKILKILKILEKMGYQIFAFIPTHLYQIISDFPEPTHPPNRRISYVDDP